MREAKGTRAPLLYEHLGRISTSGEDKGRSLYCLYKPSVSPWIGRISTQDTYLKIQTLECLPRAERLEG